MTTPHEDLDRLAAHIEAFCFRLAQTDPQAAEEWRQVAWTTLLETYISELDASAWN